MEDLYQFPIFVECVTLNAEQIKRIEKYFLITRKSGGGDCGFLSKIENKLYSIAFREQEAQQRVLQKSKHILEDGSLVLNVRSNKDPHSSPHVPSNQLGGPDSSQHPFNASSPALSGDEYELKLDPYLVRYLTEHSKAKGNLKQQLADLGCTAQLKTEKVLVRQSALPGASGDIGNWKSEVDKIFDRYLYHYVTEARDLKALSAYTKRNPDGNDLKVYPDIGMSIVVGERSQINSLLSWLDNSFVEKQQPLPRERQTSVHRLGEGKLNLLWKDLKKGLEHNFPHLRVLSNNGGRLVLEGSVEDLHKAGKYISDKDKLVFERTVSNKSPHFFTFLRNIYEDPAVLSEFLGVGEKLTIELRDTGVHFFSLCAKELDNAAKTFEEKFTEMKIYLPNCSIVPSELQEKLKNEAKGIESRVRVLFPMDNTVHLLGHTEGIDELNETVTQFILDHLSVEGKVILPFPELLNLLPELLQLHDFDFRGVNFEPQLSFSTPTVVLKGPSNIVNEVRNRLGPFLDSICRAKITIDLPAAVRYFESLSGRETLFRVSRAQKSLVLFDEETLTNRNNRGVAKYGVTGSLQVLVYEGDITQQYADALVNAANEDLDHCGGVAAALSKAAGPQMQKESRELVKQTGKIKTGEAVLTTGGNLKCKKLLHAVGPVGGRVGGREKDLIEKTVRSALDLAEMMEFSSIAIPCISSGVFGIPVVVCAKAIVTAIQKFGSQSGRSLNKIILIDNRKDVVREMQEACRKILQRIDDRNIQQQETEFQMGAEGREAESGAAAGGGDFCIEIVQGTIENQMVDVLVCPMLGQNPLSTRIGNVFSNAVGPQLTAKIQNDAAEAAQPGDVAVVENLAQLHNKAVIFLNQLCWDNNQNGRAVQALRQGIQKILATCVVRGFSSVAFPVLGSGVALRFPNSIAARVLMQEVAEFKQSRAWRFSFLVRIVVHLDDRESLKALQDAQVALNLKGFTQVSNPIQASLYKIVSETNDVTTAQLDGVQIQIIHGNIINAGTDVIVNTTDFSNYDSGVSKAILTAAGPTVHTEITQKKSQFDLMCTTGPGTLGCKEIVHASFKSDPDIIKKHCKKIIKLCESKGHCSVAFPAVNTGAGKMDCGKSCKAMLDGFASAIQKLKPKSLTLIRIVIADQAVFQVFRSELASQYEQQTPRRFNLKETAKEMLKKFQKKPQHPIIAPCKPQPAVLRVFSCGADVISTIRRDLEMTLQKELTESVVEEDQLSRLDDMVLDAVQAKVSVLGISLEHRKNPSEENGAKDGGIFSKIGRSQSTHSSYLLKGLKADVLSVTDLLHRAVCKDLQEKNEANLALTIQWSVKDESGEWHEMSLRDNYRLEDAYLKRLASVDVSTPQDKKLNVNVNTKEATDTRTGFTFKFKRCESETTLELPSHWEQMQDQNFKKVELQNNSAEYDRVAKHFLQTAKYTIQKIERVQNLYLWHAYSVCRHRLLAKNGEAGLGERFLFHGTSAESCNSIERDKFDRAYAGKHAALYGKGVYFAVNANYSADRYSPADASGMKRLYVAHVLTGRYTAGKSDMIAPPILQAGQTDRFDSTVDRLQQPSMFVIYHDDQAYPEYCITFK